MGLHMYAPPSQLIYKAAPELFHCVVFLLLIYSEITLLEKKVYEKENKIFNSTRLK